MTWFMPRESASMRGAAGAIEPRRADGHDSAWVLMVLGALVFAGTMLLEAARLHG